MNSRAVEIMVGVFMALFLVAMGFLILKASNLGSLSGTKGYELNAYFENVGGLRARAPVTAGGVRVGQVESIEYDAETFEAKVTLIINDEFSSFPEDTSASIYTAGLLGEQYIGLEPGAEDITLGDGDEIFQTSSALVLERLIGQALLNR